MVNVPGLLYMYRGWQLRGAFPVVAKTRATKKKTSGALQLAGEAHFIFLMRQTTVGVSGAMAQHWIDFCPLLLLTVEHHSKIHQVGGGVRLLHLRVQQHAMYCVVVLQQPVRVLQQR